MSLYENCPVKLLFYVFIKHRCLNKKMTRKYVPNRRNYEPLTIQAVFILTFCCGMLVDSESWHG